ncbi:MAG: hypothetical protein WCW93_01335 [Candidatus Paceibacterota bacterium]
MVKESISFNSNRIEISKLRAALLKAEAKGDEEAVLALEAELRALEKGEVFNREQFLLERAEVEKSKQPITKNNKHNILKEMQDLSKSDKIEADSWTYDGIHEYDPGKYSKDKSYENTFRGILDKMHCVSFTELVKNKSLELGRKIEVMDLFGGAYFLSDLENVSRIIGVRTRNIDEILLQDLKESKLLNLEKILPEEFKGLDIRINDYIKKVSELMNDKKRLIIEGNLYKGKTWKKLTKYSKLGENHGFDLIVCRPQGVFNGISSAKNITNIDNKEFHKEEIFLSLLERTLKLLSPDGGVFFTQLPNFDTKDDILNNFMYEYIKKKEKEGYEFLSGKDGTSEGNKVIAFKRIKN